MSIPRPPILLRLQEETRPHHQRAEAAVGLLAPGLTGRAYRRHLERLWGLYGPLEAALEEALRPLAGPLAGQLAWPRRRKVPLLAVDLAHLGHTAASCARLPRPSGLPALPGLAEALGALYVLEGATLGGQVLRRHLARVLPAEERGALAFFTAYGEEVGPMWRTFGVVLGEACAAGALDEERVLQGARDTFDAFTRWLSSEDAPNGAAPRP